MIEELISRKDLNQTKLELLEKQTSMVELAAKNLSTIKTIMLWWCIVTIIALLFLAYAVITYEPPTEFR